MNVRETKTGWHNRDWSSGNFRIDGLEISLRRWHVIWSSNIKRNIPGVSRKDFASEKNSWHKGANADIYLTYLRDRARWV